MFFFLVMRYSRLGSCYFSFWFFFFKTLHHGDVTKDVFPHHRGAFFVDASGDVLSSIDVSSSFAFWLADCIFSVVSQVDVSCSLSGWQFVFSKVMFFDPLLNINRSEFRGVLATFEKK